MRIFEHQHIYIPIDYIKYFWNRKYNINIKLDRNLNRLLFYGTHYIFFLNHILEHSVKLAPFTYLRL